MYILGVLVSYSALVIIIFLFSQVFFPERVVSHSILPYENNISFIVISWRLAVMVVHSQRTVLGLQLHETEFSNLDGR